MKRFMAFISLVLVVTFSSTSVATEGVSMERLDRITRKMDEDVANRRYAGAAVGIVRRGKVVYLNAAGFADVENAIPMSTTTIVGLDSMTKPIVGIAALMQFEHGKFRWSDPVAMYLPEFEDVQVAVPLTEPVGRSYSDFELRPPKRPILIMDLVRHTAGWGLGPVNADGEPLLVADRSWGNDITLAEGVVKLAAVPLERDPGEAFIYGGFSMNVLARLIEVWSDDPLDEYLKDHLFEPLKMHDTFYNVPQAKWSRVAVTYRSDGTNLIRDEDEEFDHTIQARFFGGGGGLFSTVEDLTRLITMLVGGGRLDGVRILSPASIDLMGSDILDEGTAIVSAPWQQSVEQGYGFGIAVSVSRGPGPRKDLTNEGAFGWGGYRGTLMWVDRKAELGGVFVTQLGSYDQRLRQIIKSMSYQAIVP